MTVPSLYQLNDVRRDQGSRFSLRIPALTIESGQVLGLLGPTGSGKSTLLHLLAGLDRPTEGSIAFQGSAFDADELPLATQRTITMVHQRPLLLRGTVRENVEYGLRLRGRRETKQLVDSILRQLGLETFAEQTTETLSGGQSQLVALARALVIQPDVLLLDEPTAHLDPSHVAQVEQTIAELRDVSATTVIWATHHLFQARRVADRVALLWNGGLVESAPTSDFFERPQDARTVEFVTGRSVY